MVTGWVAANVTLAMSLVMMGWLLPQYMAMTFGTELSNFLTNSPFHASCIAQACWASMCSVSLIASFFRSMRHRVNLGSISSAARDTSEATPLETQCQEPTLGASMWLPSVLSVLVMLVHATWYASYSRTTVAANTVLWNTEVITTPFIAALIFWRRPSRRILFCGVLCLIGTCMTVNSGGSKNTLLGCALCLTASVGFGVNAVLVEKYLDTKRMPVTRLLAWEGIGALMILGIAVTTLVAFSPETGREQYARLPSFLWCLFLGTTSCILQIGWLWCTKYAGATWAAMLGSCSIPISFILDAVLFGTQHSLLSITGALVIVFAFVFAQFDSNAASDSDSLVRDGSIPSLPA
eukprot:TRINITY_DN4560_c0_g3_i1.p1 TRINITY_DN4560_c0_g3~~TRINITY_DN4560_c0_g3_i1.p1  ORF type:complete len:351 (+),score=27.80 TRINITY_DN4560_c0_g3_i1:121-1173(+)